MTFTDYDEWTIEGAFCGLLFSDNKAGSPSRLLYVFRLESGWSSMLPGRLIRLITTAAIHSGQTDIENGQEE